MENEENKFRVVQGKLVSTREFLEWSEDKWMSLFEFAERFLEKSGGSETYRCDAAKLMSMEEETKEDSHPWAEFMHRIDRWSTTGTALNFLNRFTTQMNQAIKTLKYHPALISERMKEMIEKHPHKWGRALSQYSLKETLGGSQIVTRDTRINQNFGTTNMTLPSIQQKAMGIQLKILDSLELLLGGLSKKDIDSLTAKGKLDAIAKLAPFLAMKNKVTPNHFTQINIQGGVRDVEKGMLDFVKKRKE